MNKEIEIPEGYEARIEDNKVVLIPKESEDDRIRKAILGLTYLDGIEPVLTKCSITARDIRTYLEKQKDILRERAQNITTNMLEDRIEGIQRELIEFLSNTINASWVDIIKSVDSYAERIKNIIEKQKEQKPDNPCDGCNNYKGCITCVKGDQWAHIEECKNGAIVLEDFNGGNGFYKLNLDYLSKEQVEEIEKLVALWNSKEQKPVEWSEEDEDTYERVYCLFRDALDKWYECVFAGCYPKITKKKVLAMLKSLYLQPHWKSSDE